MQKIKADFKLEEGSWPQNAFLPKEISSVPQQGDEVFINDELHEVVKTIYSFMGNLERPLKIIVRPKA